MSGMRDSWIVVKTLSIRYLRQTATPGIQKQKFLGRISACSPDKACRELKLRSAGIIRWRNRERFYGMVPVLCGKFPNRAKVQG